MGRIRHQCWDTLDQDIPNWHIWPLSPSSHSVLHLPAIETHNNYLFKFYDCKSIILGCSFPLKASVFYFYLCACLLFICMNGRHSHTGAPCLSCALCTYVEYQSLSVMPRVGKCLKGPEGSVRSPGAGFVSPTDMELGAGLWSLGEQQELLMLLHLSNPLKFILFHSFCSFLLSCLPLFCPFLFDVKDGAVFPHTANKMCVHDRNF